jgi:predicted amidophosphoribosyltransferase
VGPAGLAEPLRRLAGLLFQRPCLLCGARVDDPALGAACQACWGGLEAERVPEPGFPGLGPPAFDEAFAAFAYRGPLRELVHAYKFEGRPSLRRPLAAALARRCEAALDRRPAAVVALPLAPASLRERGYDAGGELAASVAAAWRLPLLRPLRWTRPRRRQSALDRPGRLANAAGSMAAEQGMIPAGGRLLVVDDLLSSGATAHEAARALKERGADWVGVAALAHALI